MPCDGHAGSIAPGNLAALLSEEFWTPLPNAHNAIDGNNGFFVFNVGALRLDVSGFPEVIDPLRFPGVSSAALALSDPEIGGFGGCLQRKKGCVGLGGPTGLENLSESSLAGSSCF